MPRLIASFTLLFALTLFAAPILQCPRCGTEYQAEQTTCARCGGGLPTAAPEAPAPAVAPVEPARPSVEPFGTLFAEQAREILEEGDPVRAWQRARHAQALKRAAGLAPDPALQDLIRTAQAQARAGERPCFACGGDGKRMVAMVNFDGKLMRQAAPAMDCPVCAGRGRLTVRPGRAAIESASVRARRTTDDAFRALGWSYRSGVWLPDGADTNLDVRAQARLRTTWSRDCEACLGAGAVGCASCEGVGRTPCPNASCVMGSAVCATCDGTRRVEERVGDRTVTRSCKACRATGIATCAECEGQGYLRCNDCAGRGEETCSRCDGAGTLSACRKCHGEGFADCASCRGTGTYRDAPCATCRSGGVTLCKSCQGHGVSRR